ncbi:MAG: hypothetical protein ACR2NN_21460 [Bryobacteraceae bacterium]
MDGAFGLLWLSGHSFTYCRHSPFVLRTQRSHRGIWIPPDEDLAAKRLDRLALVNDIALATSFDFTLRVSWNLARIVFHVSRYNPLEASGVIPTAGLGLKICWTLQSSFLISRDPLR